MIKLVAGALLVLALMLHGPVQGQGIQQSSEQTHSMSKASFEMGAVSRLDLPDAVVPETSVQRGFSAASLASALIEVLASQHAVTLHGMSSGSLDADLRPPVRGGDEADLFRQARSIYDDATTIHSPNAEVRMDPLKMRCSLRINLNRLLSN